MRNRPLDHIDHAIIAHYGLISMAAIGEKFNISRQAIHLRVKKLRKAGRLPQETIHVRPVRRRTHLQANIAIMLADGHSVTTTATALRCAPVTVHKVAKSIGLSPLDIKRRAFVPTHHTVSCVRLWNLGLTARSIAVVRRTTKKAIGSTLHHARKSELLTVKPHRRRRPPHSPQ